MKEKDAREKHARGKMQEKSMQWEGCKRKVFKGKGARAKH